MTKSKATGTTPRNKNGKTNNGTPYRYSKSVKSKSLKSANVDMSVLNKNEMTLLNILRRDKLACIPDLQDEVFPSKSYQLYGTSDTRNLLRRIGTNSTGSKLIERVPGERGYYRLTSKGTTKLAEFKLASPKKAAKKKAAPKKKAFKKVTKKVQPKKKKAAPKKKAQPAPAKKAA